MWLWSIAVVGVTDSIGAQQMLLSHFRSPFDLNQALHVWIKWGDNISLLRRIRCLRVAGVTEAMWGGSKHSSLHQWLVVKAEHWCLWKKYAMPVETKMTEKWCHQVGSRGHYSSCVGSSGRKKNVSIVMLFIWKTHFMIKRHFYMIIVRTKETSNNILAFYYNIIDRFKI